MYFTDIIGLSSTTVI